MKYKNIPLEQQTDEQRKEFCERCMKFWDKLELLCKEEGIIPWPHYCEESSFCMEAWNDENFQKLKDKRSWVISYLYGITVEDKTE